MLLLHVKNLIKNNINNNNNKNNNNNRVNFTSPSPSQNSKETVLILGYSMVKKLKGFLLTRKLNHKWVVKARPFSSAKVRCMHDHIKPTVTDFNLNHIILHCRTNDPSSERTASQIARSITELALSLKSQDNKISISLVVAKNENFNNKASEVNSRLIHMCA